MLVAENFVVQKEAHVNVILDWMSYEGENVHAKSTLNECGSWEISFFLFRRLVWRKSGSMTGRFSAVIQSGFIEWKFRRHFCIFQSLSSDPNWFKFNLISAAEIFLSLGKEVDWNLLNEWSLKRWVSWCFFISQWRQNKF